MGGRAARSVGAFFASVVMYCKSLLHHPIKLWYAKLRFFNSFFTFSLTSSLQSMNIPWFRRKSKLYVGLDMGSSFMRMAVEQVFCDGKSEPIGEIELPSAGMRHGEVYDPSMVARCLHDICKLCEHETNIELVTVYLAVSGAHFLGENHHASYRLPEEEYLVNEQYIEMVREKARAFAVSDDRFVVNDWCGRIYIDKRETTRHPVGLAGRTLDLACHIMSAKSEQLQHCLHCLRQVPLEVEDIVFAPFAAAQFVLQEQNMEDGALLINMGGGTTDYICYDKGDVLASGCIAYGGININQELMQLKEEQERHKISMQAIEYLKCRYGDAFGDVNDRELVSYCDDLGLHPLLIERGLLNRTICESLRDVLRRIKTRLERLGVLRGGMQVFLTGGVSQMKGMDSITREIFGLPVRLTRNENGYKNTACFSTAIGLLRYAQTQEDEV